MKSSILSFALAVGTVGLLSLNSCGKADRPALKRAAPADAVLYLGIDDWPSYRESYPEEVMAGAFAMQKLSLGGSGVYDRYQGLIGGLAELSTSFSGEVVLWLSTPEGFGPDAPPPPAQLVADFSGDAAQVEALLSQLEGSLGSEPGEETRGFAFTEHRFEALGSLHYAVADGLLVASNDMAMARRTIGALRGEPLQQTIEDASAYQRALSYADGYNGALLLFQATEGLKAALAEDASDAEQMEQLGLDAWEGAFVAYPRGAQALERAMGGALLKPGSEGLDVYRKPEGRLELPAWAPEGIYLAATLQVDLSHLKDGVLEAMEAFSPGTAGNYEAGNQAAAGAIGVTIDQLLEDGLGDQLTIAVDMDMAALSGAMAGEPARPPMANPLRQLTIGLAVADRAMLNTVLDAVVEQAGGMLQSEEGEGARLVRSLGPLPGMAPGTTMGMALSDTTLFLSMGPVGSLESVVDREGGELSGAFAGRSVLEAYAGREDAAIAALAADYQQLFAAMKEGLAERAEERLSEEEQRQMAAYFDFVEELMQSIGVVVTEEGSDFLFYLSLTGAE